MRAAQTADNSLMTPLNAVKTFSTFMTRRGQHRGSGIRRVLARIECRTEDLKAPIVHSTVLLRHAREYIPKDALSVVLHWFRTDISRLEDEKDEAKLGLKRTDTQLRVTLT